MISNVVPAPLPSSGRWKRPTALAVAAVVVAAAGGYAVLRLTSGSSSSSDSVASTRQAVATAHPAPSHAAAVRAAGTLAALPAQQIFARSMAAARTQGSVVFSETSAAKGHTEVETIWSGSTTGLQTITIDGDPVEIRAVSDTAYVLAPAAALQTMFGFSADDAATAANRWLEFSPGTPGYDDVISGLTMSSAIDEMAMSGVTKRPVTTIAGRAVIPLTGRVTDPSAGAGTVATIYVAATGVPLPVRLDYSKDGMHSTGTFGGWRSQQVIVAPPTSINLSNFLPPDTHA